MKFYENNKTATATFNEQQIPWIIYSDQIISLDTKRYLCKNCSIFPWKRLIILAHELVCLLFVYSFPESKKFGLVISSSLVNDRLNTEN